MIEVGSVCLKTVGREAGSYCVVLKKVNQSFVSVTGPNLLTGVKRRRCNTNHLQPTDYRLEIKEDANDEEVIAAYEKANLITKLNLKKPSAARIKEENKKEGAKKQAKEVVQEAKKEKKETKKADKEKSKK